MNERRATYIAIAVLLGAIVILLVILRGRQEQSSLIEELKGRIEQREKTIEVLRDSSAYYAESARLNLAKADSIAFAIQEKERRIERLERDRAKAIDLIANADRNERLKLWREYFARQ